MNFFGGVVKSASFTRSWGLSPGSGTIAVLGASQEIQAGQDCTFSFGGATISGLVKSPVQEIESGRVTKFTVVDYREQLAWEHIECAFNLVEIVEKDLSQPGFDRTRRYYHIYPDDWHALKKTYTKDPITANAILRKIFTAKKLKYRFDFQDHPNLATPAYTVDALHGKEVGALVQEVIEKVGLLMTIENRTLRFCVKGEDTAPQPSYNSDQIEEGDALSNNATAALVVGDRSLYQDLPVKLEPGWNRAWEKFVFEPDWLDEVNKRWGPFEDSPSGRAQCALKARQVTVADYVEKRNKKDKGHSGDSGADSGGGKEEDYADYGKWGDASRMAIPAWVYLQEIVWKAYNLDRQYTLNGLDLFSLELKEGLLRTVTYSPESKDGGLDYADPEVLYPNDKAFVVAQGQPFDLQDPSKIDVIDPDALKHLSKVWRPMNKFHLDTKNYAVIFEEPVFAIKGWGGEDTGGDSGADSGGNNHSGGDNGGGGNHRDNGNHSGKDKGNDSGGGGGGHGHGKHGKGGHGQGGRGAETRWAWWRGGGKSGKPVNGLYVYLNRDTDLPDNHPAKHLVAPNASAEFEPANVIGSFCFAAEAYSKRFGSPGAMRENAIFVGGICYNALYKDNAWKEEIKYVDDKGADEKAEQAALAATVKEQTYLFGGFRNLGTAGTVLNGSIDRVTYELSTAGTSEKIEYTKERGPTAFEGERELERRRQEQEIYPGQRKNMSDLEQLGYWASLLKALKQGQQAKLYANLNDLFQTPVGNKDCAPNTVELETGKPRAGDCVFLDDQGKHTRDGRVFAGIVIPENGKKKLAPIATQGVVPVRIEGPVEQGDVVGCDKGKTAARVGGERPVGTVMLGYSGNSTVCLPVRMGAPAPIETPYLVKLVKRGGKDKADQLGVIANSHLVVSNEKGRYELKVRGLQPKIFPVGKVGDKIWMRIEIDKKVEPSAAEIINGRVGDNTLWKHFPDPIEIGTSSDGKPGGGTGDGGGHKGGGKGKHKHHHKKNHGHHGKNGKHGHHGHGGNSGGDSGADSGAGGPTMGVEAPDLNAAAPHRTGGGVAMMAKEGGNTDSGGDSGGDSGNGPGGGGPGGGNGPGGGGPGNGGNGPGNGGPGGGNGKGGGGNGGGGGGR